MGTRGPKPGCKVGGRKKGTPNKITGDLKAMILGALDKAGGIDYLHRQAGENPSAFLTLVGKVLPLQVAGDPENPISLIQRIERVIVPHSKN
jgi:hypothetical protein